MKMFPTVHRFAVGSLMAGCALCCGSAGSGPGASAHAGGAGVSGALGAGAGLGGGAGLPDMLAPGGGGAGGVPQGGNVGVAGAVGSAGSATGGSAGASGGASAGAAGAAGPCAHKLCESFESGALGAVPMGWTALQGYSPMRGGIGLASDQAHSGSMALKSDSKSAGQDRVQLSLSALGATASKHWGRLFYKVQAPAPKPNSGVIHITFAALEGTTENRVVDTVEASNGTHQWLFNIPDDSCCMSSSYDWTFDAVWHCAEWYVNVSAESYRFFSDGKEVTPLAFTGKANAKMSNYTSLALGTIFYQTPPSALVVWFDDLAIDDSQIGCQ